jgi:hypothetical protein
MLVENLKPHKVARYKAFIEKWWGLEGYVTGMISIFL